MSTKKFITKSAPETQQWAAEIARQILRQKIGKQAVVLALEGELGAGKTTFVQGFAKGLGVREKILSPTFIVMKRFKIYDVRFKNFYHFDCYRLNDPKEILQLGFKDIISNPKNIVVIEWPERIEKTLSKKVILIQFRCDEKNSRTRTLTISK